MQTAPRAIFVPVLAPLVPQVAVEMQIAQQVRLANPTNVQNNNLLAVATKNASWAKFAAAHNVQQDVALPMTVHEAPPAKVENAVPSSVPVTPTVVQARSAKPTSVQQGAVAMWTVVLAMCVTTDNAKKPDVPLNPVARANTVTQHREVAKTDALRIHIAAKARSVKTTLVRLVVVKISTAILAACVKTKCVSNNAAPVVNVQRVMSVVAPTPAKNRKPPIPKRPAKWIVNVHRVKNAVLTDSATDLPHLLIHQHKT